MKRLLLNLIMICMAAIVFGQGTISPATPTFNVGDPMIFDYTGGTGDPTDWIGIYNVGDVPGPTPSITWDYITTPSGSFTIIGGMNEIDPLDPGVYVVNLFCCDGYDILATSTFKMVSPTAVKNVDWPIAGNKLELKYFGATEGNKDWIGVYKKNDIPGDSAFLLFEYVGGTEGTQLMDSVGVLPAGDYDAHLFCCDGFTSMAKTTFKVYPDLDPSIALEAAPFQNGPITFNFAGGTGHFKDWIGVYNAGDVPGGGPSSIDYLYVEAPNGSLTFDSIPGLVPGNMYDAHFLCCDGYDIVASLLGFTVGTSSSKDLTEEVKYFTTSSMNQGVRINFNEPVEGKIIVYNLMGQVVNSVNVNNDKVIELSNLQFGTYVVNLQGEKVNQTSKVFVR